MTKAWNVFHEKVSKMIDKTEGLEFRMTSHSEKDWDHGVCAVTNKGMIHILGDGTIVDDKGLLRA
ncbi:hypothetical protein [Bacillus cereus group sp. BfR-BA-01328]|uniref:hypothetical protein n=1 Tax=Bacillus cereus group sp. BfR-BA-01328 TaxID=2920304 RepID=UPI001F5A4680